MIDMQTDRQIIGRYLSTVYMYKLKALSLKRPSTGSNEYSEFSYK